MRLTLPTKTALLTTALVLFAVGATGAWQYRALSGRYIALMQQQQQGFAALAANDIDYKIGSHLDVLVREARRADAQTFATPEARQDFLARSDLRTRFDGLALIAPDGAIVASDPPNPRALSVADRDYFQRARESGQPAISAPLQSRTTDRPAIVMVVPVRDAAGSPVGMVGAGLSLSQANVLGDLSRARVGEGGHFLIETTGPAPVYVVHPDPARVLQPASHLQQRAAGDLVASVPIPRTGWVLRTVLPAAAAYAPLARARESLLAQMLVLGVLCSVFVWSATVWILRPLGRLHGAIETLRRNPGQAVPLDVHARDELGDLAREFAALIAERTRAEEAMRTLTAIFEATTDYVVQLDKAGRLTYMNPAARRVTGLAADAPIHALTMADFYPPATLAHLAADVVPTAAAQGVWVGELDLWKAGKRVLPVSQMVIAHRDRDGEVEHYSAIMRDISADKANKLALSESEARLRTMADALPMRVAYVGADERYQFANLAYEGVFGVRRETIEGQTVKALFGEAGYVAVEPHVRAALAGQRVTFETEVVNAAGYACYEASYIPQWSVDGHSVVGFHAVTLDITRQKHEERRLVELASQDPLTGLGNRSAFEARLAGAMGQSRQDGSLMALLYVDLDRFKQINDRWGHPCGDALLRAVAARLSKATRTLDFAARLGGDEFTLILQALGSPDDALQVAEKILASLNDPFVLDERTLHIGASIGVACYAGSEMTSGTLIRKADEMLYQAKGAGRNNIQVAPAPPVART